MGLKSKVLDWPHPAMALAAACAITQAVPAWAQAQTYSVDLPAQELGASLKAFARSARQQVTFDSRAVQGKRAPALRGRYSVREALDTLLAGSGLQARTGRSGLIIIARGEERSAPAPAPARAAARPEEPQDAAAPSAPAPIEEIVVTAEKRSQTVQTVPASVSAVTGQRLNELGLSQLTDYSQYIPGMNVQSGGSPGQASITLRGIAPVGPGSVVGYYIDDTPLGSSTNYAVATLLALDLMPYDVERFEVLRGPQGTLYGAGAMGGLIKYVLKPADSRAFSAQVGGELNDYSGGGLGGSARAAINIPLIAGRLAVRGSVYDRHYGGYTDNVFRGDRNSNTGRQYGGRLALAWTPTDNLRVNLNGLWNRTHSRDNAVVTLGDVADYPREGTVFQRGEPVFGRLAGSHPFLQPFRKAIDYYSGTIAYDAPFGVTFTSATSYSRSKTRRIQDSSSSYGQYPLALGLPAAGYSDFLLDLDLKKFTQEVRAASATGGFAEWMIGGFYTHEKSANQQEANVYDTNYQQLGGPFFSPYFLRAALPSTYDEYAAFGNLTLNLTPKLSVTGGLRYAHNDQDFRQILDGAILGGFTDQPGRSSEGVVTWSVSGRYRFTREIMAYARVATGYRPGGPNLAIPGAQPSVDSDRLTSYEAGLKSTFLNGRAQFNITAFDIDWKGIQLAVSNAGCGCSYLANGGNAFSRGVELEGAFLPAQGLRIGYNAAYTKARLTSIVAGAPPLEKGFQLPGVPKFSGGITADYSWPLGDRVTASIGGGLRHVGGQNVNPVLTGGPNGRDPSYTTGDLRAGLAFDRYRASLFVRNLANKLAYLSQAPQQNPLTGAMPTIDATPLQPRVIGISLDLQF